MSASLVFDFTITKWAISDIVVKEIEAVLRCLEGDGKKVESSASQPQIRHFGKHFSLHQDVCKLGSS